jgi:homoserine dehydrogenase
VKDRPGVLARVASVMAKHARQHRERHPDPADRPGAASLVLTTHESNEKAMRSTLKPSRV